MRMIHEASQDLTGLETVSTWAQKSEISFGVRLDCDETLLMVYSWLLQLNIRTLTPRTNVETLYSWFKKNLLELFLLLVLKID